MSDLVGVVPAAGAGRRMFPGGGVKELLPVGSESATHQGGPVETPKFVGQFVIEAMAAAGVPRVVVVTSHAKSGLISQYLNGDRYGIDVCYVVGSPRSMVHAIDLAYPWVGGATVVMGMPDTVIRPVDCFRQLLRFHSSKSAELSLGLFPTESPERFGMVETDDSGTIVYHADKPPRADAAHMWGIAAWQPSFTERVHAYLEDSTAPTSREVVLGDVFDEALAEGRRCKAVPIAGGEYHDVGTYADYQRATLVR